MNVLQQQRRPSPSVIKLIECIGTLLGVPLSKKKSPYKAPLPSNYDDTLLVLAKDFYGCMHRLSAMQSDFIDHDVATKFYNKMLEPGFDYEDAVNNGGLIIRELYNLAFLVFLRLQADNDRVPVVVDNILLVMDGSRSSYNALDAATHIRRHGSLHIGMDRRFGDIQQSSYLGVDIRRRCVEQFKIPEHCFCLHELADFGSNNLVKHEDNDLTLQANVTSTDTILSALQSIVRQEKISILTLPVSRPQDFDFNLMKKDPLYEWALSPHFEGDIVLSHGNSFKRPFTDVEVPRTHLLYIPYNVSPNSIFIRALRFCRPGDALCIVSVFPSRRPLAENRETRYDFGNRHGWHSEDEILSRDKQPISDRSGWNDTLVEQFQSKVEEMIQKSAGVSGFVRIERVDSPFANHSLADDAAEDSENVVGQKALSEKLMQVAFEENCSSIIFYYGHDMNDPAVDSSSTESQPSSPTRPQNPLTFTEQLSTASSAISVSKAQAEMSCVRIREKILRGLLQQAYSGSYTIVLLR